MSLSLSPCPEGSIIYSLVSSIFAGDLVSSVRQYDRRAKSILMRLYAVENIDRCTTPAITSTVRSA